MTITVELLRDDALDLIHQLEKLSILRVKKDNSKKNSKKKSRLRGSLKTGLTIDEIDLELKNLRN